jgi:hypothetical protein
MLYYRGKPIGGAGIGNGASGSRAKLKLFKNLAEQDKQAIIAGCGANRYLMEIDKIDAADKESE